jgi:hypothetical protein
MPRFQSLPRFIDDLRPDERRLLARLRTPARIQDFLETLPINFEWERETCMSPRRVIATRTAHCLEGALLAAAALWFHGRPPLLLDLKADRRDVDHVVALFHISGRWGAISKTNHSVLRFRDPVYRTPRELAMSYFHEYFKDDGRKTLVSHSAPFDLSRRGGGWVTSTRNLWDLSSALDISRHFPIASRDALRRLRRADPIECRAGLILDWPDRGPLRVAKGVGPSPIRRRLTTQKF